MGETLEAVSDVDCYFLGGEGGDVWQVRFGDVNHGLWVVLDGGIEKELATYLVDIAEDGSSTVSCTSRTKLLDN